MNDVVFRNYTQAALDREYNNQAKHPGFDFQGFLARCARSSEEARRRWSSNLDVPYGPSAAERLDIFTGGPTPRPVEIFFHGGYWRMLDKKDFSYVANGLVPHGVAVAVVNYALIPAIDMDGLVAQCRSAVSWVFHNIERFGGDPTRLHLSGHSAGGHLVAMLLATEWQGSDEGLPTAIRSAAAISGIYDLEPIRLSFLNSILQLTPRAVADNSPVKLRPSVPAPLLVAAGEHEGEEYLRQSNDLVAAWTTSSCRPELAVLRAADHFSIREELGDPDSRMVSLMMRRRGDGRGRVRT